MERDHDAPASRRGRGGRGRAAFGRVAKPLLVESALHQVVQVGVHADTLPRRAGRRIGEITGRGEARALHVAAISLPIVVVARSGSARRHATIWR